MNYTKIQQDLVKELVKKPTNRTFVKVGKYKKFDDEYIFICTGYVGLFIPERYFYLDYEKLVVELGEMTQTVIEGFVKTNLYDAYKTDEVRMLPKNRTKKLGPCTFYKVPDKEDKVLVSDELMKYFDGDTTYKGTIRKAPIFVYENEELVGFALPINYDK